jgi:hypothetical protein
MTPGSGRVKKPSEKLWYLQFVLMSLAIILLMVAASATSAQSEGERFFDETGHTVRGPFLVFFDAHGGLGILGYPLTDEFVQDGRLVQYFQRGRLEWHPENSPDFRVQLGLLADQMNWDQPRRTQTQVQSGPNCHYFPETGHAACDAFLDYFRDHGGLDVFGYPISEQYIDRDRIVQAFQRARMEWHPEKPASQRVQLTLIGRIAFDFFGLDPDLLGGTGSVPHSVTRLTARASVKMPVTARTGTQVVYVVVKDQLGSPVAGATVTAVVRLPTGTRNIEFSLTDEAGRAIGEFDFTQTKAGDYVFIDVSVNYLNVTTTTRTSFLPWK